MTAPHRPVSHRPEPHRPGTGAVPIEPAPRWVAPVFAALGAAAVPWTVYLSVTLPEQARTHNYRVAWVGFDLMLIVALLATAYLAERGKGLVGPLAAVTATMLVLDAWFDVTTSRRAEMSTAILSAVLVELPLALVCGWIALHADQVIERRLRQLARREARLHPDPTAPTAAPGSHTIID